MITTASRPGGRAPRPRCGRCRPGGCRRPRRRRRSRSPPAPAAFPLVRDCTSLYTAVGRSRDRTGDGRPAMGGPETAEQGDPRRPGRGGVAALAVALAATVAIVLTAPADDRGAAQ